MQKLTIIKIGGNIIDDEIKLSRFLQSYSLIVGAKILVHGGGKLSTTLSSKLGIETKLIDGRRITDSETLKVVSMVYAGWINKSMTAELNSLGVPSVGICGADGECIPALKRPVGEIDYGFVGDVQSNKINFEFFQLLLNNGFTPIVAPITSEAKQLLNTNADTIAGCLAVGLSKFYDIQLIYCFEKNGVLKDINNSDLVFETLDEKTYQTLKQTGSISHGMIPKLDNAFLSLHGGVKSVSIGNAENLTQLLNHQSGTEIVI